MKEYYHCNYEQQNNKSEWNHQFPSHIHYITSAEPGQQTV